MLAPGLALLSVPESSDLYKNRGLQYMGTFSANRVRAPPRGSGRPPALPVPRVRLSPPVLEPRLPMYPCPRVPRAPPETPPPVPVSRPCAAGREGCAAGHGSVPTPSISAFFLSFFLPPPLLPPPPPAFFPKTGTPDRCSPTGFEGTAKGLRCEFERTI